MKVRALIWNKFTNELEWTGQITSSKELAIKYLTSELKACDRDFMLQDNEQYVMLTEEFKERRKSAQW